MNIDWYCKEGISNKCQKLLKEFSGFKYLRKLKRILNYKDKEYRKLFTKKFQTF